MTKQRVFSVGIIINVVFFIALIVLYGLYFTGFGGEYAESTQPVSAVERHIDEAGNSIAFVDNEVLMDDYLLAVALRSDFDAEQRRLENDLERRQRNFQIEVERFQRDIERGHITMDEAQLLEQELMSQQQDLYQLGDTYRERLARKEFEMNSELLDSIRDFLDRYNEDNRYDFILGYARGGGILHANKAHDITEEILQLLNEEYEQQGD
jgi:outer membrane protein